MKKELRINEIMKEKSVNRKVAEILFEREICKRYGINNLELAESMFKTDWIWLLR